MKLIILLIFLLFSISSFAAENIKLIVSSGVGGITHKYALKIAPIISKALDKNVVVEVKSGAEGYIAARYVNSIEDETVLLIGTPQRWENIKNVDKLSHLNDFNVVSYLGYIPSILVSHTSVEANNFIDLLMLGKEKKVSYGISANNPLRPALKKIIEKYSDPNNFAEITYKGGSSAIADLIGKHIDFAVSGIENISQFLEEGRLKALAIVSDYSVDGIKNLKDQNIFIEEEFKHYPNIFLWSNKSANEKEIDKIKNAVAEYLSSNESDNLKSEMYLLYDSKLASTPNQYLIRILK